MLAVSTEYPIGIDLEIVAMRKSLRRIARKMFDHEVVRQLESLDDEDFKQAFFVHWTPWRLVPRLKAGVFFPVP